MRMTTAGVTLQTSAPSVPSTPAWFGDVALLAHDLHHLGVRSALAEAVRFARERFGDDDTRDVVVVW